LVKHLPKAIKNELSTNKELSIKREFIDEDGNTINLQELKQGQNIFSKITLVNYGKIEHVVINQRIPACLTIVNNNISGQQPRFKNENITFENHEIRDDRILDFVNLPKKEEWNRGLQKNIIKENRGVLYAPLIVTTVGECQLPAVITEAMYDTRINDYAKSTQSIRVIDSALKTPHITSKKSTLNQKAKALVKELYTKEMNSKNPLEFANFFEFPLAIYFRNKDFTKEKLLQDKRNYFKTWTKRIYTNMKTSVEEENPTKNEVKVKIRFDYQLNNGEKVLKGTSRHLLTVVEKSGKLKVTAVEIWKEKR